MPTRRSGLNGSKRPGSLLSSGPELSTRSGMVHNANAATPVHATRPRIPAAATLKGTEHIASTGEIVGEARQVVAALGPITATAAAQIKPACFSFRRCETILSLAYRLRPAENSALRSPAQSLRSQRPPTDPVE